MKTAQPKQASPPGDAGLTLVDLLVAITIIAVFVTMFTATLGALRGSVASTHAISRTVDASTTAMGALGNQARRAMSISQPGAAGGYWFVEWSSVTPGVADCVQTRMGFGVLQQRTWNLAGDGQPVDMSGWNTVAHGVDATGGADPFTLHPADGPFKQQRLTVRFTAAQDTADGPVQADVEETFTAIHTRADTEANTMCTGRRQP